MTSELVTNALVHAATDVGLFIAQQGERLRLAVRDRAIIGPRQDAEPESTTALGLMLVEGFSHAWGSLPTVAGGKVVWAVPDV